MEPVLSLGKTCPQCGDETSEGANHCHHCGAGLEKTEHPLSCPSCKGSVRPEWALCPKCGVGLKPDITNCPQCAGKVQSDWTVCPFCGADIGANLEPVATAVSKAKGDAEAGEMRKVEEEQVKEKDGRATQIRGRRACATYRRNTPECGGGAHHEEKAEMELRAAEQAKAQDEARRQWEQEEQLKKEAQERRRRDDDEEERQKIIEKTRKDAEAERIARERAEEELRTEQRAEALENAGQTENGEEQFRLETEAEPIPQSDPDRPPTLPECSSAPGRLKRAQSAKIRCPGLGPRENPLSQDVAAANPEIGESKIANPNISDVVSEAKADAEADGMRKVEEERLKKEAEEPERQAALEQPKAKNGIPFYMWGIGIVIGLLLVGFTFFLSKPKLPQDSGMHPLNANQDVANVVYNLTMMYACEYAYNYYVYAPAQGLGVPMDDYINNWMWNLSGAGMKQMPPPFSENLGNGAIKFSFRNNLVSDYDLCGSYTMPTKPGVSDSNLKDITANIYTSVQNSFYTVAIPDAQELAMKIQVCMDIDSSVFGTPSKTKPSPTDLQNAVNDFQTHLTNAVKDVSSSALQAELNAVIKQSLPSTVAPTAAPKDAYKEKWYRFNGDALKAAQENYAVTQATLKDFSLLLGKTKASAAAGP